MCVFGDVLLPFGGQLFSFRRIGVPLSSRKLQFEKYYRGWGASNGGYNSEVQIDCLSLPSCDLSIFFSIDDAYICNPHRLPFAKCLYRSFMLVHPVPAVICY